MRLTLLVCLIACACAGEADPADSDDEIQDSDTGFDSDTGDDTDTDVDTDTDLDTDPDTDVPDPYRWLHPCDEPAPDYVPGEGQDSDGDGYEILGDRPPADCDDGDPSVHPGALEVVGDGKDNDCDPLTPDVEFEPGCDVVEACESSPCTIALEYEVHTLTGELTLDGRSFDAGGASVRLTFVDPADPAHMFQLFPDTSKTELVASVPEGDWAVVATVWPSDGSPAWQFEVSPAVRIDGDTALDVRVMSDAGSVPPSPAAAELRGSFTSSEVTVNIGVGEFPTTAQFNDPSVKAVDVETGTATRLNRVGGTLSFEGSLRDGEYTLDILLLGYARGSFLASIQAERSLLVAGETEVDIDLPVEAIQATARVDEGHPWMSTGTLRVHDANGDGVTFGFEFSEPDEEQTIYAFAGRNDIYAGQEWDWDGIPIYWGSYVARGALVGRDLPTDLPLTMYTLRSGMCVNGRRVDVGSTLADALNNLVTGQRAPRFGTGDRWFKEYVVLPGRYHATTFEWWSGTMVATAPVVDLVADRTVHVNRVVVDVRFSADSHPIGEPGSDSPTTEFLLVRPDGRDEPLQWSQVKAPGVVVPVDAGLQRVTIYTSSPSARYTKRVCASVVEP